MKSSSSERRMVENEAVFRRRNEHMQQNFNQLKTIAEEDHQEHLVQVLDIPLYFYCECSDENCRERIQMKSADYNSVHTHRDRFVIRPGHDVKHIERIVKKQPGYWVVQKFILPPESGNHLQPTDVHNT